MASQIDTHVEAGASLAPGMGVTEALGRLFRSSDEIAELTFVSYKPAPDLSERLAARSETLNELATAAQRLRDEFGIPFWDAVLAMGMKQGSIPESYVDLAILHDRAPDERSWNIRAADVSEHLFEGIREKLAPGYALAISSRVKLSRGGTGHIPMLDFRCNPTKRNEAIVIRAAKALGERSGVLVNSGRSYHLYGFRLLTENEWIRFLGLALLFSPVVDARYLAHRLADGACRLRLFASSGKTTSPTVTRVF